MAGRQRLQGWGRSAATALPPVRRLVAQRDRLLRQRDELRGRCDTYRRELAALTGLGTPGAVQEPGTGYRYAFILTYGRSGSTLLQNILCAAPGVLIRGENHTAPYQLYRYHRDVLHHRDRLRRPEPLPPTHPWYGIDGYPEGHALAAMRQLVLDTLIRPVPGARIVGFKEINWPDQDLPAYLDFLRAVFPGARFVVNTRNLADVAQSKWWARRPDALEHLAERERQILHAAEQLGGDAYRVHYDDYCADHGLLRPLHDWLGTAFDRRRVDEAMAVPASY